MRSAAVVRRAARIAAVLIRSLFSQGHMESLITSTGKRIDPQAPTAVMLHPGVGISVNGKHLGGGSRGTMHTVPRHIALELIASSRAHYPSPEEEAAAADTVSTQPQSRDPEPVSNDPRPKRTR